MDERHPDPTLLERFAQGVGSSDERQEVVRHLLRGCSLCGGAIRNHLKRGEETDTAYDLAIDRAVARVQEPANPTRLLERLERLLELPADWRGVLLHGAPELQTPAFLRLVLAELESTLNHAPQRMLRLSEVAIAAVELVAAGDDAQRRELRAEAWAHHGNALRVHGRLPEAERAFRTAEGHSEGASPHVRARLLRQKASLRSHQHRFAEAVQLAEDAARIYRCLGRREDVARCLVKQAIYLGYAGQTEEAFARVSEALPLIESDRDLTRQAAHVAARFSIDLGRPDLGSALLDEVAPFLKEGTQQIADLRFIWLRGELAHAGGRLDEAEQELSTARQGLLAAGLPLEGALVSLELAVVYASQGRSDAMAELLRESLPIFQSIGIGRQSLASLRLLHEVAASEACAYLQRLTRELRRNLEPR